MNTTIYHGLTGLMVADRVDPSYAHRMAAAPELYEEIEALVREVERREPVTLKTDSIHGGEPQSYASPAGVMVRGDTVLRLKAALSKARGEA